jgi:hypothetical protein
MKREREKVSRIGERERERENSLGLGVDWYKERK